MRSRFLAMMFVSALLALAQVAPASAGPTRFAIQGEHFMRDGKPHVIISGEIHYPRIPREYWRDRLRKARAMGLNTIQTYTFWNLHEPQPGKFDFSGNLDVAAFVRIAREEGLDVIVRPGPYICTELDFGGLPAWLLKTPGLRVRSFDPRFLRASAAYIKRIGQELESLQSTRGGPIILVQVENEYGSYGTDHEYMEAIKQQVLDAGFDVPLFTSDGPGRTLLEGGTLPGVTPVINFSGGRKEAEESFAILEKFRRGIPRMVGEYWAGWFDHWGEQHHVTNAAEEAETVDWMLAKGISVNLYMFHGGTSFGYQAGANSSSTEPYQPDTSSYDYDAPLDEAGRPTKKYFALREVIRKHLPKGTRLPDVPEDAVPSIAIPRFNLDESVSLQDALPMLAAPVESEYPRSMEDLGQNYGFLLYRTTLRDAAQGKLNIGEPRDYAVVIANGTVLGKLDRRLGEKELPVALKRGATLDLLVENMGRINFGQKLSGERKGLIGPVLLNGKELSGWRTWSLPLEDVSALKFKPGRAPRGPAFWRGSFELASTGNTFLDTRGWGKGHAWINGHHLGRYWKIGPQQTLHVPGAWLRAGRNEVVVLDVKSDDVETGDAKGGVRLLQGLVDPVFDTPKLDSNAEQVK